MGRMRISPSIRNITTKKCPPHQPDHLDKLLSTFKRLLLSSPPPPMRVFNGLLRDAERLKQHSTVLSMFRHLCSTDKIGVAVELFVDMSKKGNPVTEGVKMNNQTFCTLISGLCTAGQLELAIDLFNKAMANGLIPDVVTYTTIIKGLCEASHEMKAREMIIRMEKEKCPPDDLTFNVMVCGFLKKKESLKAVQLAIEMRNKGFSADNNTLKMFFHMLENDGNGPRYIKCFLI